MIWMLGQLWKCRFVAINGGREWGESACGITGESGPEESVEAAEVCMGEIE